MYKVHLTKSFKKDAKALNQADRILSMQIIDTLATVLYACKNIEERLPLEKKLQEDVASIENSLMA